MRIKNQCLLTLVCLLFIFAVHSPARGQVVNDKPAALQRIDVEEHPGDSIPLGLTFADSRGDSVRLADYFKQGRPVLLNLVYFNCPMLCTLVLNGVANAARGMTLAPGTDFQMVAVSIDPRDTPVLAEQKQARYLGSLGKANLPGEAWEFLVADSATSGKLAAALGFKYYYDKKQDVFAHPAVTFLLTENGKISRYLYGLEYPAKDLKLALLEAAEGKIGTTLDKLILYCYHYDPESGSYVLFATNFMRIGGLVTLVVIVAFLGIMWKKERQGRLAENNHRLTNG